jgi:hypothetical protein
MFSYEVTPLNPLEHVCRVGYDPGVDSFFFCVSRPLVADQRSKAALKVVGENNGHVVEWQGTTPREIDSVEELAAKLTPWATLPRALYQTLRDDRLRRGPTRTVEAVARS